MMDPEEIGKKWIQSIEKNNNLQILRKTDSEFLASLKSTASSSASPLCWKTWATHSTQILEPLLTKKTFEQGGSVCLKLGYSILEYHKDMRLYITSKSKNSCLAKDTVSTSQSPLLVSRSSCSPSLSRENGPWRRQPS